jgi:hypothetical protein
MVAQDDGGDNWMSLSGSSVMMGTAGGGSDVALNVWSYARARIMPNVTMTRRG